MTLKGDCKACHPTLFKERAKAIGTTGRQFNLALRIFQNTVTS